MVDKGQVSAGDRLPGATGPRRISSVDGLQLRASPTGVRLRTETTRNRYTKSRLGRACNNGPREALAIWKKRNSLQSIRECPRGQE